jgi:predicted alpha/beta superfamily hydrolase
MMESVKLHDTEDHVLHSEHVGQDFHLWIGRPVAGFAPSKAPPVPLWVLDGDLFFGTAVETTRLMHQLYGELPPILVIGVAYGMDDPRVQGELRTRDFTPTADARWLEGGLSANPDWQPVLPEGRRMGRADAFLRFLVDEARPYVEDRFEAAWDRSTLFGSSMGGLFAAWAALTEPAAFRHVIAVSPSLWWDDAAVLKLEEKLAGERDDLSGRLFLGVGGLEEPEHLPFLARYRLISNVRTLAERLESRGYPSLDVRAQVLEGEAHTSVPAVGLTRGLRAFLRGVPPAMPGNAQRATTVEGTRGEDSGPQRREGQ